MFANRSSFDRLVRAIFITALLAIGASHAWGRQTSTPGRGAIRGAVTDQSGAVIASAYIYATNRETGAQYQTRSGPDGGFLLDQLPLAEYDLKVTAQGFSNTEMRIPLGLDSVSAPHNVQLDVALGVMTISVKMVVSTESYATVCIVCGYTYFSIPFNDLPLKDRDVQRLVFLQPVVTEHEGEFSIQGARPTNKSATIDDLNDREPAAGKFAASLSLDAINEFNSDASQAIELFGSSYGQDTGPELAAKSKTGSNSYHAQAYEFAGRTGMSANNFFTGRGGLARDQRRYDQLGGAFGGPVSLPGVFSGKDRVFFFISYEHTGDFERTGEQAVGLTESFLRKTAPIQGALFKTLLSEGRIPVASGIAARSFDLNGDGSPDLSEIGVRNSQRLGRDLGLVRLDFRISDRTQLSGIVNYDGANRSDGFENGVFSPGSPVTLRQHGSLFGFKLETVINPSMVNEAMIGGRNWRAAAAGGGSDAPRLVAVNSPFGSGESAAGLPETLGDRGGVFGDKWQFVHRSHSVSVGFQYLRRQDSYSNSGLANGRVHYSDLLALVSDGALSFGDPSRSIVEVESAFSPTRDSYHPNELYAFVSDQWRPTGRTVVNAGLNYNYYSTAIYDGDKGGRNNIAPFTSFAVALSKSETWIVRGGGAIVFAPPTFIRYGDLAATPLYPLAGAFASRSDLLNFSNPNWMNTVGARSLAPVFASNLANAYMENSSLAVQYTPGEFVTIEAGYNLALSHHLIQPYNLNRTNIAALDASRFLSPTSRMPGAGDLIEPNDPNLLVASDGNGSYNAFHIRVTSRERRHMIFQVHYTFSKSIDNSSTDTPDLFNSLSLGPVSAGNIAAERALSDFDRRHRALGIFSWEITPSARVKSFYDALKDGWEMGGIVSYQSGGDVSIYSSGDFFGGRGDFNGDGVLNDRPAYSGPVSSNSYLGGSGNPADRYLNAAFFTAPAVGGPSALGRNMVAAPGYASIDLSVRKTIEITESQKVQARIEAFNVMNRVNFAAPVMNIVDPEFGASTSASAGRVLRLELRYSF